MMFNTVGQKKIASSFDVCVPICFLRPQDNVHVWTVKYSVGSFENPLRSCAFASFAYFFWGRWLGSKEALEVKMGEEVGDEGLQRIGEFI